MKNKNSKANYHEQTGENSRVRHQQNPGIHISEVSYAFVILVVAGGCCQES